MTDCHAAKEAQRDGDHKRLTAILDRLNETHWAGWNRVRLPVDVKRLDIFIGHTVALNLVALTRLKYEVTLAKEYMLAHAAALSPQERDGLRRICLELDTRIQDIDVNVREMKPPLKEDAATGLNFYTASGVSTRKMTTATSTATVSAGLPATLTDVIGHGVNIASARGPEVQVAATQTFNKVENHPNRYRVGEFYTLNLSVRRVRAAGP